MFKTMAEVRAANKAIGNYWFERKAMLFFGSRIESKLYMGKYFISSEDHDSDMRPGRRYTIREVLPDGSIKNNGEYQGYKHIETARAELRNLLSKS